MIAISVLIAELERRAKNIKANRGAISETSKEENIGCMEFWIPKDDPIRIVATKRAVPKRNDMMPNIANTSSEEK